jgi:hypothetical protein
MEKRKKSSRFVKNRVWKSKLRNKLKGKVEDICHDYFEGVIDHETPVHFVTNQNPKARGGP